MRIFPIRNREPAWLCVVLLCGLISGAATTARSEPSAGDPWQVLTGLRDELSAGPSLAADFVQAFVPGGFSSGDQESGVLYIGLPRCLRFEYQEPFPKDFLLCGDWVYTWNPDEPSGRRFLVNDSEAEGLDLLRLEVDALRKRYRADFGSSETDRTVIRLTPLDEAAEIREASVELASAGRLLALAYEDRSGNQTRFAIADYRELGADDVFKTPAIQWLED